MGELYIEVFSCYSETIAILTVYYWILFSFFFSYDKLITIIKLSDTRVAYMQVIFASTVPGRNPTLCMQSLASSTPFDFQKAGSPYRESGLQDKKWCTM